MRQHHQCSVCGRNNVKLYRKYGGFLRDSEIYCKRHLPKNKKFIVPLVESEDGSVWGYTSVPPRDKRKWENLPDE